MRKVVATGMGCVSGLGADKVGAWRTLIEGGSGIRPIRIFAEGQQELSVEVLGACVPEDAGANLAAQFSEKQLAGVDPFSAFAAMATLEALKNALKLARHIVRSEKNARVLVLSLELCSLHLKETTKLDEILSFLIFADGCAASIVSADPSGLALDSFRAVLIPETQAMITWNIGDMGFDMFLSGRVPATIQEALRSQASEILAGSPVSAFDSWAVHPGGRSVLDAVERALDLKPEALAPSRAILRRFGNMSSATVMFVLEAMLRSKVKDARGCAMSFGPGLIAETMLFHHAE